MGGGDEITENLLANCVRESGGIRYCPRNTHQRQYCSYHTQEYDSVCVLAALGSMILRSRSVQLVRRSVDFNVCRATREFLVLLSDAELWFVFASCRCGDSKTNTVLPTLQQLGKYLVDYLR